MMKYQHFFRVIFFQFILFQLCFAQADQFYNVKVSKFLMGTTVETDVQGPDIIACKKALFLAYQEMERVENLLSFHKPASEISKINRAAGTVPVKVSEETFAMVKRAKAYSQKFDGLFDVTIGAISQLWGFNDDKDINIPADSTLARLLPMVNYRWIDLNDRDTTVYLSKKGMKIDLGGIAKGYAIDRGVFVLKENHINQFFLNAGGDIYTSGKKDGQSNWRVGVKHPRQLDRLIAKFELSDYAVATSGDYERYAIIDGKRYHHILDPRNGFPSKECQSVTVLAPTAEEADATATYLFVLGFAHLNAIHSADRPFLIVDGNGEIHDSDSFDATLHLEILE